MSLDSLGYLEDEVAYWRYNVPTIRQPDTNLIEILKGEAQHNLQLCELKSILKLYKNSLYDNVFRDRIRIERNKPDILKQLQ